jgi:hypothetical protein
MAGHRIYLAAVGALALWVGVFCYFDTSLADWGIPWPLPPLCAAFVGSMYLSGAVGMTVCILSSRWTEIRPYVAIIAIWTGGLTVVSLLHLDAFNFHRAQDLVWFGAYIAYPLIGLGLLWRHRGVAEFNPHGERSIPRWANVYVRAQGVAMIALSLALLLATPLMQALWPWQTGRMMLQLYSQPILAFGVGSLIISRQAAWSEVRAVVISMAVFTGAELLASLRFIALFDGPPLSVAFWFASLGAATSGLLFVSFRAVRMARAVHPSVPGYLALPRGLKTRMEQ